MPDPVQINLTPTLIAARQTMFHNMLPTMMWGNPTTQYSMIGNAMGDYVRNRRKRKHYSAAVENIINQLQAAIAMQMAQQANVQANMAALQASPDPVAMMMAQMQAQSGGATLSGYANSAANNPATGAPMFQPSWRHIEDIPSMYAPFQAAQQQAQALTGTDQLDALDEIRSMQQSIDSGMDQAQSAYANYQPADIASASSVLANTPPAAAAAVAASVPDPTAAGATDSSTGFPKWGYFAIGAVVLGGVVWYFKFRKAGK